MTVVSYEHWNDSEFLYGGTTRHGIEFNGRLSEAIDTVKRYKPATCHFVEIYETMGGVCVEWYDWESEDTSIYTFHVNSLPSRQRMRRILAKFF